QAGGNRDGAVSERPDRLRSRPSRVARAAPAAISAGQHVYVLGDLREALVAREGPHRSRRGPASDLRRARLFTARWLERATLRRWRRRKPGAPRATPGGGAPASRIRQPRDLSGRRGAQAAHDAGAQLERQRPPRRSLGRRRRRPVVARLSRLPGPRYLDELWPMDPRTVRTRPLREHGAFDELQHLRRGRNSLRGSRRTGDPRGDLILGDV